MKRPETRNLVWRKRNRNKQGTELGEWTVHLTKSFSVTQYGSKEKAYKMAVKFRDKYYKLIYREFQENYICENLRYREYRSKEGKIFRYYRATYYDATGNVHEKNFNIDKLGEEEALKRAKECAQPGKRWDLIKTYAIEDNSAK